MTEYVDVEISDELYNRLRKMYESCITDLSFDEFVNELIRIGLEYDKQKKKSKA